MNQDKIERFALCHYLSEFPDKVEYEKVLDLIMDEDEEVAVWQPFEDYEPGWVVEHIEEMVVTLNYWFAEEFAE
jgi:hypothetical protein